MKTLFALVVVLFGIVFSSMPEQPISQSNEIATLPPVMSTPLPVPTFDDEEEDYTFGDVLDEEGLMNAYTRPIAKRTVLRSKPWEDSKPNLETALVPGDIVQIYPNKRGESEWVEVWVPRYRVTGYVRIAMLGEVK